MSHYQQSLVIEASPAAVFAALTTPEGLRGWWTRDCDVAPGIGSTLRFRFGAHRHGMRVDALVPEREVRWQCIDSLIDVDRFARRDEWVGTQVVFELVPEGSGRTRLDFAHVGLVPDFECHEVCSNGWRHFLASLQQYARTGHGTPYVPAPEAAIAH